MAIRVPTVTGPSVPDESPEREFDAAVAITLRTMPCETPNPAFVLPPVMDREARMAAFRIHLSQWLNGLVVSEPAPGEYLH